MELAGAIVSGLEALASLKDNQYEELVEKTFVIILKHEDEKALEGKGGFGGSTAQGRLLTMRGKFWPPLIRFS